jgi:hypothetical protein
MQTDVSEVCTASTIRAIMEALRTPGMYVYIHKTTRYYTQKAAIFNIKLFKFLICWDATAILSGIPYSSIDIIILTEPPMSHA